MADNFDQLEIGGKFFNSRLMLGTGKYKTTDDAIRSIENSHCEIFTFLFAIWCTLISGKFFREFFLFKIQSSGDYIL